MNNEIKGTVATVGNISGTLNAASGYDGASAYELALKNGFEGTEAEWIESLQGKSGVYLGSGEMPTDCNVQIDPNGEADFSIDDIKTENGTVVSGNADFAEVAEWADGNPDNEDRTGYFVCANVPVDGIVMRKATSTDDVKGVTILAPAFAGNYTKDKLDSNGNLLPKYSYVAILGFVPVRDNGTCTVGGRCMPDDNGCAIPSSNSMGYQVVNRIDENRVLIIIEPNGDMVQRVKTKITELKEEIKRNSIHNSASGENILLTDSSNYAIEGLRVYGKSTQDGTPTPEAPIPIVSAGASGSVEVKVCGANLAENLYIEYVGNLYGKVLYVEANLTPNTTYTFSFKGLVGNTYYFNENLFSDWRIITIANGVNSFSVTTKNDISKSNTILYEEGKGWRILMHNTGQSANHIFEDFMLNIGSTALPYEPYTEQTLTLTTPNELHSVGDYADYIDLERGVFVQNCYKATEKDFKASIWKSTNAVTLISTTAPKPKTGVRKELCNISGTYRESWEPANTIAYHFTQIYSQSLVIVLPVTYTTEEQGQEVLNNGIEFVYILETPIETPLTAEELAYYKALHTNYPNTTIFNSDGTNMDVSYIADTKLYIDNKFAELQALALEG